MSGYNLQCSILLSVLARRITFDESIQSGAPSLLPTAAVGREAQEVGADGLHAEVADYTQCDGEDGPALDSSGQFNLTIKTVAPVGCPD